MESGKGEMEEKKGTVSPCSTIEYHSPVCDDELKPHVGQLFPSVEAAIQFYRIYAEACGFSIRVNSSKKSKDGSNVIIWKYLVCNREGFKHVSPYVEFNPAEGDLVKRRTVSNRCGCDAKMWFRFAGNDGYRVTHFVSEHTHPMLRKSEMQFSKSSRKVTPFHKDFIMNCIKSNVGVSKSYKVYKNLVGSYANVGATVVDFKNFLRGLNSYMVGSDAQMVLDDFYKRKERSDSFYFDYFVNKEDQLCRLFWCDAISRKSFSYFGDVVSADATYQLNSYNMVFVPFTGVDNHKKSITFAAGLLLNEDIPSYVWLFDNLKKAMGREPYVIITDQDAAVKSAVEQVFSGSVHRLCMWHIMKKVNLKVRFPHMTCPTTIDGFHKKFNGIVWSEELTPIQFEEQWSSIISEYGLEMNEWLRVMFDLRCYWIPSFFHDVKMAGLLRTTSRSESQNSFFGNFLGSQSTLVVFMMQFNSAIESQRHNQKKLDLDSSTCCPRLKTPLEIERHCASIYTINMFYDVQEEICGATYQCSLADLRKETDIHHYEVSFPVGKNHTVQHVIASDDYHCSCNKFLSVGIPCCHIFMVFKNLGIKSLPTKFINTRWTKQAILQPLFEVDGSVDDGSAQIDEKKQLVTELLSEMHYCVDILGDNIDKMNEFLCVIKEQKTAFMSVATVETSASTSTRNYSKYVGALPDQVNVHPPPRANNKGRKRRIRSGQEIGIENSKKQKRTCVICKKSGHNYKTCPQYEE